jgi:cytoplasmic iron level regulating protein YaaA (DUF328/UPF0246 family)
VFTLTVDPAKDLADAVLRQTRLVLANSEAVHHLEMFKNPKIVTKSQELIRQVSNVADPNRFNNLEGCRETLQDLNTCLFAEIAHEQ